MSSSPETIVTDQRLRAPPVPAKMTLYSQYGVCAFRACMRHLLYIIFWPKAGSVGYHVVIADGHSTVAAPELFSVAASRRAR
jgi:hypothetical protein